MTPLKDAPLLVRLLVVTALLSQLSATSDAVSATQRDAPPERSKRETTPPPPVSAVENVTQTETSITLSWNDIAENATYILTNENNGVAEKVEPSSSESSVTHTVYNLTAGTRYNFTLITVVEGVNSTGFVFKGVTVPLNPKEFRNVSQTETNITLQWNKVEGVDVYWIECMDETECHVNISGDLMEAEISSLQSMTEYNFTLFSVLEGLRSSGVNHSAFTAPPPVSGVGTVNQTETSITLQWNKVTGINLYHIDYMDNTRDKETDSRDFVMEKISGLQSMTKYDFTIFSVFKGLRSSGASHSAFTAPSPVSGVENVTQTETSITLRWNDIAENATYILTNENNGVAEKVEPSSSESSVTHTVYNLTAGTRYNFTLITVVEGVNSTGFVFKGVTVPLNPKEFGTVSQTETSITLQWNKVEGVDLYWIECMDETECHVNISGDIMTAEISGLQSMTKYDFTLFSVLEGLRSSEVHHFAFTAPPPVSGVDSVSQTETSITLRWNKIAKNATYILTNENNSVAEKVEPSSSVEEVVSSLSEPSIEHTVSNLSTGMNYTFTLITVFQGVNSTDFAFHVLTVPPMVAHVTVTNRTVSSLTLSWDKQVDKGWTYILEINGTHYSSDNTTIKNLDPGTKYWFSVTTEFGGLRSMPYENYTVTTINCSGGTWNVTSSSISGEVKGLFTSAGVTNESLSSPLPKQNNLSFTDLYPGATYQIKLFYEKDSENLEQCRHFVTILPSRIGAHCPYFQKGYGLLVVWNQPYGVWTDVEVIVAGQNRTVHQNVEQSVNIGGLQPATTYHVSVTVLSNSLYGAASRSETFNFSCITDPRGVIAGSFFGVLFFIVLVCLIGFILWKRTRLSKFGDSKASGNITKEKSNKAIPVAKFPDHVSALTADQHRGFSMEYETLLAVGQDQTKKVALLPENRSRNRFVNIHPYDWSRVRLNTPDPDTVSDYINASYMPGYKNSREYIATQGPLPSTVNDFWRMIWEQKVRGIVMVTNCVEVGRTKCEKYWPEAGESALYGELQVTAGFELKNPFWTLREFNVKHSKMSGERTVRHFHFTAWPDHGVPDSTDALIRFRNMLREHIETNSGGAPTVVHCSAGVGRTGTIISLDVLLQQLEEEKAVDIKTFVHQLRLRRPHMVQTESQYIFLYQCIMDYLQSTETDAHLYENSDTIYVNATALKALHHNA